jgi:hypothetical protein
VRSAQELTRGTTVLSLAFRTLGVAALLSVPALSAAPGFAPRTADDATSPWRGSWSERYPGCVAAVLWPSDEQPVAAVVRTSGGSIVRVSLDQLRPLVPDGTEPLGLCR